MAGKYSADEKVKPLIREWNKELYALIEKRSINGESLPLHSETVHGIKSTWSLSFESDGEDSTAPPAVKKTKKAISYHYTIHLNLDTSPEKMARGLLEELAHVKIGVARASCEVASDSDLFKEYEAVLESADRMDVEKSQIITKFKVISKLAKADDRSAKAGELFRILVEEKYVNDMAGRATGHPESDLKLAWKYAKYEAAVAANDGSVMNLRQQAPGKAPHFAETPLESAVIDLHKAVLALYGKIPLPVQRESKPPNGMDGVQQPPVRQPQPSDAAPEATPPQPNHAEKHGFLWKVFHPLAVESTARASGTELPSRPLTIRQDTETGIATAIRSSSESWVQTQQRDLLQRQQREQAERQREISQQQQREQMERRREQSERMRRDQMEQMKKNRERMDEERQQRDKSQKEQRDKSQKEQRERMEKEKQDRERQQTEQRAKADRDRQEKERQERAQRQQEEQRRREMQMRSRPIVSRSTLLTGGSSSGGGYRAFNPNSAFSRLWSGGSSSPSGQSCWSRPAGYGNPKMFEINGGCSATSG